MGEISANYLKGVAMLSPRNEVLEHYGVKGMRWGQRRAFRNSLAGMKTRNLRRMEESEYKKLFKAEADWNRVHSTQRREKIASVLAGRLGRKAYNSARRYRLANRTKWGLLSKELGKRDFKSGMRTDKNANTRSRLYELDTYNNDGIWKRTDGVYKQADYWKPVKPRQFSVADKIAVRNDMSSFNRQYHKEQVDKMVRAQQREENAQNNGKVPRNKKPKWMSVVQYG